MEGHPITLNIYASSPDEAERGRQALIRFIDIMRQHGAAVRGDKISSAVAALENKRFVLQQVINYLRQ